MLLIGVDPLATLVRQGEFSAKMVCNERGAIFFPTKLQHCDQKAEGFSYEDNYAGNALATMLAPGRIEIRFHWDFADRRVAELVGRLLAEPSLNSLAGCQVTYQGRPLRGG